MNPSYAVSEYTYEDSDGIRYTANQFGYDKPYTWHDPATGKWGWPTNIPKGVQSDTFVAVRRVRKGDK